MESPRSDDLKDFLLSRQHATADREERREEWLNAVERLFQKIAKELLAEAVAQNLVTISRANKQISEEYLGTYEAPELILCINGETVRFSPKGRNIIGAKGRVDLVGDLDTITLVLEPAGDWNVVISRVPLKLLPLDGKTLAEALRTVMR